MKVAVADPRPLTTPIPMRGTLGLRDLSDDLEALVSAQLPAAGR